MPTVEDARRWYRDTDPVHGFDHVMRVLDLAQWLGRQLGADLEVLRAAALLHDASGAEPREPGERVRHEEASAHFARRILEEQGWARERIQAVVGCILAHRFRGGGEAATLEAQILFDADKLDVLGAFGVARTIGYAVQAGEPIFAEPTERFLDKGVEQEGEPHSAYHEYIFKLRHVPERLYTAPAKALARRRHVLMVAFFDQLATEARGEDWREPVDS